MTDIGKSKKRNTLIKVRSKYILAEIFAIIQTKKFLEMICYNKKLKKLLNKKKKDYKEEYLKIEIELFPIESNKINPLMNRFIKIDKNKESFYHIYFNDETKEQKKYIIKKADKISKSFTEITLKI